MGAPKEKLASHFKVILTDAVPSSRYLTYNATLHPTRKQLIDTLTVSIKKDSGGFLRQWSATWYTARSLKLSDPG